MSYIEDDLNRMREDMTRMFDHIYKRDMFPHLETIKTPLTDIYETASELIVSIELPGVNKEDIYLTTSNHQIHLKADSRQDYEVEDKKKGYYKLERSNSSYFRQIPLPKHVDENQVKTNFKNGILELRFKKIKQVEGNKLEIE